jgi:hypothetical protein
MLKDNFFTEISSLFVNPEGTGPLYRTLVAPYRHNNVGR